MSPAAANRNPARYRDPEAFDICRTDGGHLALGHGIHHCLGAPLARMEGRIALAALHTVSRAIRLAVDPAELQLGAWRRTGTTRAIGAARGAGSLTCSRLHETTAWDGAMAVRGGDRHRASAS